MTGSSDDLVVTRVRAVPGPNYWRLAPVITCDVRLGALDGVTSAELPGFTERLLAALPSLHRHPSGDGSAGGFIERLTRGTPLPDVLAQVALDFQTLAGSDVHFGRAVASGDASVWWVVVEYVEEEVGEEAMRASAELLRACIAGAPYDAADVVRRLAQLRARVQLDPSTAAIVDEARGRGIPVRRHAAQPFIQLGLGRTLRRVRGTVTDRTSMIGGEIARDVEEMRRVLAHVGLPTLPDGAAPEEALAVGREHRVLVVGGRVVACAEQLQTEGAGADAWADRTDAMHADNVRICELAAGIVGLDVAGIDVRTPDISVPFRDNAAVIVAVHAGPSIRVHTHPTTGTPRNVAAPIVDLLYPPGEPSSIPIIAITGTNGKTTTTRLIAHLFRHAGATVGFTTTDGIYLGDRLVVEGDMTGPFSANVILSNPTVDVAVLETARGGILRGGLGFDACDVGVVLNVTADHLGLRGIHTVEQLADVKGVIPAVAKRDGHAVLNADDPLVYGMRERTAAEVVLFSTQPAGANPAFEAHVARGGIAARLEDDRFVVWRGGLQIPIASVEEVPLMLGGAARFQAQNVLAAVLAAHVRGMGADDVRAGLRSFVPSPAVTPGRLNVLRLGRRRVVVDYAHNAAAVTGLVDFAKRLDARRRIGMVTSPGDRRDEDLRTLGRLTASLDHVIVKEDEHGRGRPRGEIARLLREGLLAGGLAPESIEEVLDEPDAVRRAVALLEDDDVALLLVNEVRAVLAMLGEMGFRA